jgi:hypothetical protein
MHQLIRDVLLGIPNLVRRLLRKGKIDIHIIVIATEWKVIVKAIQFLGIEMRAYVTADTLTSFLANCSRS